MGMEIGMHTRVYLNTRERTSIEVRRYNKGVLYVPFGFLEY
jgi:hypothetical protein